MKTSANGRRFIEGWEALVLHAYYDSAGVLSIGFGHTTAAGPPRVYIGMTITNQQGDQILSNDLAGVEYDVNRLGVGLDRRRKPAFIADCRAVAALFQNSLERVEDLHAPAQCLGKRLRAHGHAHEFLEIDVVVRMRATV